MKIGVVTGGGDCPGLNAVIRAFTKSLILKKGWEVVGIPDAFTGILNDNPQVIPLTLESIGGILPQGGTMIGTSNRADPFKFPIYAEDGNILKYEDRSELLKSRLKEFKIEALLMIGGDGTMRIANKLSKMGINIVGVPKTIDNDLSATDVTFGFDSACNIAMEALDRLHTTAYSHHRIMICEVMGRDAGWLALQAGVSGGADVILIPEIPYSIDKVVDKINKRKDRGNSFSIIIIAEGAFEKDGEYTTQGQGHDGPRFGGAGKFLEEKLQKHTTQEIRTVVLGHLQRGGSPTHFDRVLGSRYGEYASYMIERGKFSQMASLRDSEITSVTLEEATAEIKRVKPDTNQIVFAARNMGISFGD